jgi:uncharacterized protein YybS (DUF2232 family)
MRCRMNKIQTKALVEGAIFASITVVIGIIRFYVPIVALISIVWSVPTILIAFRHGLKVSINSVVVSSVLVAVLTQPIEGLGFFIGFGLPGIIMGYLLKKKLNPWKTIFITGIVLALCSVLSFYLGMLAIGVDIVKAYDDLFIEIKNAYREAVDSMAGMMGVGREEILKGTENFEKSLDMMKLILPGGILASAIVISFVNFKLTRLALKRIKYSIENVKPFSLWKLSDKGVLTIILVLLLTGVEMYLLKLPQLHALTMNIITIATLLFTILGLSVAKFFLDKYSVPKALKVIIMFFLLVSFSNIAMIAGVLDMLFNFRKLEDNPVSYG